MKKLGLVVVLLFTLLSSFSVLARGYHSSGGTHYVKSYVTKNGVHVAGHLSGNPGSGIHCHHNVCK
jgi:hypothetical protein